MGVTFTGFTIMYGINGRKMADLSGTKETKQYDNNGGSYSTGNIEKETVIIGQNDLLCYLFKHEITERESEYKTYCCPCQGDGKIFGYI